MKNFLPFLGLLMMVSLQVEAQPYLKGCKYANHEHKLQPLSESEKALEKLSSERSDTIDILNYNIQLEITDFGGRTINGSTIVDFKAKMDDVSRIELNLLDFNVDSVLYNGNPIGFENDGLFVTVEFPPLQMDEEGALEIFYNGKPTVSPGGFGGLDFQEGIAYNLGIGLGSNPYNYGRGWYPCFDNFVERATYDFTIISALPRKGYCTGNFVEEVDLGDNKVARSFRMDKLLPSYLAGVAVGEFSELNGTHIGAFDDVPTQLLAAPGNIADMEDSFVDLGGVIDALEHWFGPYAWDKVGYVTTAAGAMEHSGLIAYPTSIAIEGNTFRNRRLMAHELAHHWWGNVAGIPGASDMWFKEGNAEYSAHLITEYLFGTEAFLDQVIDNHIDVMQSAHLADEGYWPLSGIPYEHTYGVHTYNKGASMMHNLRGYLGDELYRSSMTAVQENFGFQSITADEFRDYLSLESGIDLTDFFQDWLKSPGWSGFLLESFTANEDAGTWNVEAQVLQGRRAAPEFHDNLPLQLSCYGENQEKESIKVMVSGEFSTVNFQLPFKPEVIIVNQEHTLNLAQVQVNSVVDELGNAGTTASGFTVTAVDQTGPANIFIDHYWWAPLPVTSDDFRLSTNHFWKVDGFFPENYEYTGSIEYRGNSVNSFDIDLVGETEDSLILAWRPDSNAEWMEYPFYEKNILVNTGDGFGFMNLSQVLKGEYALANGTLTLAGTNQAELLKSSSFPNPFTDQFTLSIPEMENTTCNINMYNTEGKLVYNLRKETFQNGGITIAPNVNANTSYWVVVEDLNGKILAVQQLLKA